MSESRIPRLSVDDAKAAAAEVNVVELAAELSVFRVLLRQPRVAKALQDLLFELLYRGNLDAKLRELVIMRIGWVTGSEYEWTQHFRIARDVGISEEDIVGVRDWRAHLGFGAPERAVLSATDETLQDGMISGPTWEACAQHLSDEALIELVVAIGNWRMFSSLLRSLEVPLEDGVAPWPPDAKRPS